MNLEDVMLRALPEAANNDGEFSFAVHMWDADVVFASDGAGVRMTLQDGRITNVDAATAPAVGEIRIGGPADGWEKMLSSMPPPFYQDLFGAALHHGFTIEGKIEDVYPYYPALRRLIELLRAEAGR